MSLIDRRSSERIAIDTPVFASIKFESGAVLQVFFADISKGGAKVVFSPGAYNLQDTLGMEIVIASFQGKFASLFIGKKAFICWVSAQRFGIRFHEPLDATDQFIREIADSL